MSAIHAGRVVEEMTSASAVEQRRRRLSRPRLRRCRPAAAHVDPGSRDPVHRECFEQGAMSALQHDPGGKRRPKWSTDSVVTPRFSECMQYRYGLAEIWDENLPLVMFLMMNPSVAGIEHADPTLIKTGKFARRWGFGGQLVGNVHSYRLTKSQALGNVKDPVGPENDAILLHMARSANMVVLAYGLPPKSLRPRAEQVVEMLRGEVRLTYLRLTKDGTPEHPLYLPPELEPLDFPPSDTRAAKRKA